MKVLHICSYYLSSDLFNRLTRQLEGIDVQNDIFVPVSDGDKTYWDRSADTNENVCVARILNQADRLLYYHKAKKIFAYLEAHYDLRSYDCVHAHSLFTNGLVAKMVKDKYGVPYVVALRNTDLNTFFKYMVMYRGTGVRIMLDSKRTVFLSAAYLERVRSQYVPADKQDLFTSKCAVIPNGIDGFWLEHKRQTPRELSASVGVLTVGAIERNKNQLLVARVVRRLQDAGKAVTYTIVGDVTDAAYAEKIKSELPNVNVVPFKKKEALIDWYARNDIFAMTSYKETFGLVYAEAMSQGLPLIYTKGEGFDKQFPEGEVGFSVGPDDADGLQTAIESILETYPAMSQNCLDGCEAFNWKTLAEQYKTIYGE